MKRTERTAIADFIIGILSTIIAHALAALPVEQAREFLKDHLKLGELKILPAHIAGIELPLDFLRSAGGSVAGYTVAEIVTRIYPKIGDDMVDYLQDLALMVAEKYGDLMAEKGIDTTTETKTSGSSPRSGVERIRMATYRTWYISSANPLICFTAKCPKDHHRELKQVPVGGGGGRGGAPVRTEPKMMPRVDFNQIDFEDIMATPGVHAPDATEGGGPGCNCQNAYAADKKAYDREQAPAPTAAPAPKADDKSGKERSFADFQGEAEVSPDIKLRDAAIALRALLATAGLDLQQHQQLNRCNTWNEYRALAACTTKAELIALLPGLAAHGEVRFVGRVLEEVGIGEEKARQFVGKLQSDSKSRTTKVKERREVVAFCLRSKVYTEEVLAVTPAKSRVEELTLDDVRAAILVDPATTLSPVMAYREKNKPQPKTKKTGKPAKSGQPGRLRRFIRWAATP